MDRKGVSEHTTAQIVDEKEAGIRLKGIGLEPNLQTHSIVSSTWCTASGRPPFPSIAMAEDHKTKPPSLTREGADITALSAHLEDKKHCNENRPGERSLADIIEEDTQNMFKPAGFTGYLYMVRIE